MRDPGNEVLLPSFPSDQYHMIAVLLLLLLFQLYSHFAGQFDHFVRKGRAGNARNHVST